MPYPSQVTREPLVEMAWQMIEEEGGSENVSLAALAKKFGVKAPSLYRHVKNKTELLREVNLITCTRMTAFIMQALEGVENDPKTSVMVVARAYRDFAHQYPVTYQLAYNSSEEIQPNPEVLEALAIPIQLVIKDVSGDAESLTALRGVWALIHGFVMLEINGLFRRGGDLEETFFRSIEAYVDGWMK